MVPWLIESVVLILLSGKRLEQKMVFLSLFLLSRRAIARRSSFSTYVHPLSIHPSTHSNSSFTQPSRYATMLAERMAKHKVDCWLINTGWTGGKFGTGKRCPLKFTRKIIDAIHSGSLSATFSKPDGSGSEHFPVFGLNIPTSVEGVPRELLNPKLAWQDKDAFERELRKLAGMFVKAFAVYESDVKPAVRAAGPVL